MKYLYAMALLFKFKGKDELRSVMFEGQKDTSVEMLKIIALQTLSESGEKLPLDNTNLVLYTWSNSIIGIGYQGGENMNFIQEQSIKALKEAPESF